MYRALNDCVEFAAATGLVLAARSRRARPNARRREEAMRRACRDEERAQAERVRAEAAAKTESLRRKKELEREQEKVQNYLQSKAALEAMLQNPALSETEKARIREEAKTKGLAAGFTAAQSAAAESAARQQAYQDYRAAERNAETIVKDYEVQKALQDYRSGERAEYVIMPPAPPVCTVENIEQPKSWWQQPIGYGTIIGTVVGATVGGLLGGPAGLIGGAAVGATIGAAWGSAQEGYLRTTRELIQGNPWSSRRPVDFPPDPSGATDWLLRTMQSNAQGPIAETLRQAHHKMGLLGRLVTVPNWIGLVQGGGPWDFKPEQTRMKNEGGWEWDNLTEPMDLAGLQVRRDAFSNIHYGYVGRSLGYSRWFLEFGAGIAQIQAGRSNWSYWHTWFDDPVDNAAIRASMDLYEQYTAQGKPLDENALREVLKQYPDLLCTPQCQGQEP